MKPEQMVRIVNPTGVPWDTRVIEPVSGNRIPFVRKVTWEVGIEGLAVATIEVMATLDVMANGTVVFTPVLGDGVVIQETPEETAARMRSEFKRSNVVVDERPHIINQGASTP